MPSPGGKVERAKAPVLRNEIEISASERIISLSIFKCPAAFSAVTDLDRPFVILALEQPHDPLDSQ